MNRNEAEQFVYDEVGKYTYKPDVVLHCWPIRTHGIVQAVAIGATRMVKDSTGRTSVMLLQGQEKVLSLGMLTGDEHAAEYVQWAVQRLITELEMHELDEWLKYNGKVVRNPHEVP